MNRASHIATVSCTEQILFNTIGEGDISISIEGPLSPYNFRYTIDNTTGFVTGQTGTEFNIKFEFLSSLFGAREDVITVTFHNDQVIEDLDQNYLLTRTMQTEVNFFYAALSEEEKAQASSKSSASIVTLVLTFATSFLIQAVLGGTIEATWLLLGTLQLMALLPLLSANIPANFRQFSKNLAVLNGEPTAFPNVFEYLYDMIRVNKQPFNQYFELMNFNTNYLLLNAGRKVMIWMVLGMMMCLSWLLMDLFEPSVKGGKLLTKIDTKLRYGIIIRAISQSYLSLVLSTCLNVYTISWSGDVSYFSNIIALIAAVVMLYVPVISFGVVQSTATLNDATFQKRFKTFIIDLRVHSPLCFHFISVFFFRRAVYACCFAIFSTFPRVQIFFIASAVVSMILYLIAVRPYKSVLSRILSLLNEAFLVAMIGA